MYNFDARYNFILKVLRDIYKKENLYFKPITPKLSDIELIALVLYSEYRSIDSDYQLFRELKGSSLEGKIERSVYNRRKRKLAYFIEKIRQKIVY